MKFNINSIYTLTKFLCLFFLLSGGSIAAQQLERWKLSVNNDQKPIDILMEIGNDAKDITYLFDITRDTLNMSFVAEEAITWKHHGVSVFVMPKKKEVLKLKLDNADLENVQVVFYRMWRAMPKVYKNVNTLFELHEYGTTDSGEKISHFLIRFKMKRPRQKHSIQF
ncbi:hypothetical protein [Ancylomarina longa]|uniref:Uncharacterized protein n=1 Tax=Ancylomarina longa TaxID=2487017 RepID=A0A434AUU1_9BACT|nr:hypothetical protein [Ancylomarina longa]RUT78238.1 hypothetical protein DLK05_09170 [Ancylomarina longa]